MANNSYPKDNLSSDSLLRRFWSRVTIGSVDECWEWTGARSTWKHYGGFGEKVVQRLMDDSI